MQKLDKFIYLPQVEHGKGIGFTGQGGVCMAHKADHDDLAPKRPRTSRRQHRELPLASYNAQNITHGVLFALSGSGGKHTALAGPYERNYFLHLGNIGKFVLRLVQRFLAGNAGKPYGAIRGANGTDSLAGQM